MQGFGAEGVGEMHAELGAADGKMDDLADGGVAQVVGRAERSAARESAARRPRWRPRVAVWGAAGAAALSAAGCRRRQRRGEEEIVRAKNKFCRDACFIIGGVPCR